MTLRAELLLRAQSFTSIIAAWRRAVWRRYCARSAGLVHSPTAAGRESVIAVLRSTLTIGNKKDIYVNRPRCERRGGFGRAALASLQRQGGL